eukprot:Rmarinus@m.14424
MKRDTTVSAGHRLYDNALKQMERHQENQARRKQELQDRANIVHRPKSHSLRDGSGAITEVGYKYSNCFERLAAPGAEGHVKAKEEQKRKVQAQARKPIKFHKSEPKGLMTHVKLMQKHKQDVVNQLARERDEKLLEGCSFTPNLEDTKDVEVNMRHESVTLRMMRDVERRTRKQKENAYKRQKEEEVLQDSDGEACTFKPNLTLTKNHPLKLDKPVVTRLMNYGTKVAIKHELESMCLDMKRKAQKPQIGELSKSLAEKNAVFREQSVTERLTSPTRKRSDSHVDVSCARHAARVQFSHRPAVDPATEEIAVNKRHRRMEDAKRIALTKAVKKAGGKASAHSRTVDALCEVNDGATIPLHEVLHLEAELRRSRLSDDSHCATHRSAVAEEASSLTTASKSIASLHFAGFRACKSIRENYYHIAKNAPRVNFEKYVLILQKTGILSPASQTARESKLDTTFIRQVKLEESLAQQSFRYLSTNGALSKIVRRGWLPEEEGGDEGEPREGGRIVAPPTVCREVLVRFLLMVVDPEYVDKLCEDEDVDAEDPFLKSGDTLGASCDADGAAGGVRVEDPTDDPDAESKPLGSSGGSHHSPSSRSHGHNRLGASNGLSSTSAGRIGLNHSRSLSSIHTHGGLDDSLRESIRAESSRALGEFSTCWGRFRRECEGEGRSLAFRLRKRYHANALSHTPIGKRRSRSRSRWALGVSGSMTGSLSEDDGRSIGICSDGESDVRTVKKRLFHPQVEPSVECREIQRKQSQSLRQRFIEKHKHDPTRDELIVFRFEEASSRHIDLIERLQSEREEMSTQPSSKTKKRTDTNRVRKQVFRDLFLKTPAHYVMAKKYEEDKRLQEEAEFKSLPFKPVINKTVAKPDPNLQVRGFEQTVSRLKAGREQREAIARALGHLDDAANPAQANAATTNTTTTSGPTVAKPPQLLTRPPVRRPPPAIIMEVNLGKGKTGRIAIHEDDDPSVLAENFARTYQLPPRSMVELTRYIQYHVLNVAVSKKQRAKSSKSKKKDPARDPYHDAKGTSGVEMYSSAAPSDRMPTSYQSSVGDADADHSTGVSEVGEQFAYTSAGLYSQNHQDGGSHLLPMEVIAQEGELLSPGSQQRSTFDHNPAEAFSDRFQHDEPREPGTLPPVANNEVGAREPDSCQPSEVNADATTVRSAASAAEAYEAPPQTAVARPDSAHQMSELTTHKPVHHETQAAAGVSDGGAEADSVGCPSIPPAGSVSEVGASSVVSVRRDLGNAFQNASISTVPATLERTPSESAASTTRAAPTFGSDMDGQSNHKDSPPTPQPNTANTVNTVNTAGSLNKTKGSEEQEDDVSREVFLKALRSDSYTTIYHLKHKRYTPQ